MEDNPITLRHTADGWTLFEDGQEPVSDPDTAASDEDAAQDWAASILFDRHQRGVYVWEWGFPNEEAGLPGAWLPQLYPEERAWAR